jgi:hypothetical protein
MAEQHIRPRERERERERREIEPRGKRERVRERVCVRERERERERERWLEGKRAFFAHRDVIQITSRLRHRDFGDFPSTDVLTGT